MTLEADRQRMVEEQLRRRGILDERVLAAMARVPREAFVAPEHRDQAYGDHPLPIGEGQTISQPYIVAAMLEALALRPADRVLEVGAGSGYQAALLAELAAEVYTIERQPALAARARATLQGLGYRNVTVIAGDGSEGYAAAAPYDAIVVGAAAPRVPPALNDQLAEGGRMIIPVGDEGSQQLQLVRKLGGETVLRGLELVRFVPLIGSQGFPPK